MLLSNEQRAHDYAIEAMKINVDLQTKAQIANQKFEQKSALEHYESSYFFALEYFKKAFPDKD